MPTQEAGYVEDAAALLPPPARHARPVLLDGGGADSWGDGTGIFSHSPRATLEIFASGRGRWVQDGREHWLQDAPLAQWQTFLEQAPVGTVDRAAAGFVTVLGYDLKHWIERLPRRHPWPTTPILFCAFYDWTYRLDHRARRAWIGAPTALDLRRRADELRRLATAPRAVPPTPAPLQAAMTPAEYLRMVERALAYIAAGDAYQINLAQCFDAAAGATPPASLFAAWRARYPMPFAAYVDGDPWVVLSNSPECFFVSGGRTVSTFPIKGTRRAHTGAQTLADDPKERAEHVMIVDLERNDIGRVCRTGTVEVVDMASTRGYPLLSHLISEVRGTLRREASLPALVAAMFPGGSITGAPKIRAMEIIEELEPRGRGFYTGAIGWTGLDGRSRFNLAIRTAVFADGRVTYHAGGGIVADSVPEREYEETLLKSEAFVDAWASMGEGHPCGRLASSS